MSGWGTREPLCCQFLPTWKDSAWFGSRSKWDVCSIAGAFPCDAVTVFSGGCEKMKFMGEDNSPFSVIHRGSLSGAFYFVTSTLLDISVWKFQSLLSWKSAAYLEVPCADFAVLGKWWLYVENSKARSFSIFELQGKTNVCNGYHQVLLKKRWSLFHLNRRLYCLLYHIIEETVSLD